MATRQTTDTNTALLALLWQQMRGFRGKYAWAIAALFVFTAINGISFTIEPGETLRSSGRPVPGSPR
jgi:hypothetical protein